MKLVINSCYGGFHLSPKALKRYLELKGKNAYFYKQTKYEYIDGIDEFVRIDNFDSIKNNPYVNCTSIDYGKVTNTYPSGTFKDHLIPRNDKHLIQVVEELVKKPIVHFQDLRLSRSKTVSGIKLMNMTVMKASNIEILMRSGNSRRIMRYE